MRAGQASHCAHGFEMTSPLELSIALSDNERTRPLIEGRVVPQGIKPVVTVVHPSEMFWRQLRFAEFDVSEMSMSSLIIAASASACRNISRPGRSGRAASSSTSSACIHAISNGSWSATPRRATAGRRDLPRRPACACNTSHRARTSAKCWCAANSTARCSAKTGLFPINHTVVLRRSLLERHPWVALNLYSAFVAAKEEIARYGQSYLHWYFETGLLDEKVNRTLTANDPLAYGFKASRAVLETIAQYVHEQGLRERRDKLEE